MLDETRISGIGLPRSEAQGRTSSGRHYGILRRQRRVPTKEVAKRGSKPTYQLWSGPLDDDNAVPVSMKEAQEMGLKIVYELHPTTRQEFEWPVMRAKRVEDDVSNALRARMNRK